MSAAVTILQTQVVNLQTLASTLQSDIANKTAQVAALQTQVNTLKSDAAIKTTQVATLQVNVTTLESNAVTQATQIFNIQTKLPAGSTLSNLEAVTKGRLGRCENSWISQFRRVSRRQVGGWRGSAVRISGLGRESGFERPRLRIWSNTAREHLGCRRRHQ